MGSEYSVEKNKDTGLWGVKHAQAGHWIVGGGKLGEPGVGWPRKASARDWVKTARQRNVDLYGEPELPTPKPKPEPREPAPRGRRTFGGFDLPDSMSAKE